MSRSMLLIFFLSILVANVVNGSNFPIINNQIHLLRPQSGSGGSYASGLSCLSWRFGVETNSIINWKTIPVSCEDYVGHYMLGSQYRKDSKAITDEAFLHAKSLNLSKTGANDVWVFDIDETTLSNLPYYAQHGFGLERFNATSFNAWVDTGKALALPESLKLYKKLLRMKVKIVFLTGRTEDQRTVTETNLRSVGYHSWAKLLLKGKNFIGKPAVVYKSTERKKLEEEGYRIIGNMGDQWSDLLGTNTGIRTFKLPDPMYYIS
ncbi:acid phosphatase 1-like [Humulus lupulus]|uniref:acid phosphatase 1-like n=1 Tax=Humulus lupulus TaxID=3486 RepID=UPI002B401443|nr:acid phosphatase 1-like [Humulus lupulus]